MAKGKKLKQGRKAPVTEPEPASAPSPTAVQPPAAAFPPALDEGRVSFGLTRFANALGGAALCYGEPVHVGERVVIPVARVRGAGGGGFGRGGKPGEDMGDGGGGGGALEATPAGFIDITPDGVRYEAIPDPITTARAISTGASALTLLVSAVLGVRRLTRKRSAGLLPRPR
ncbi:MAG: hypothetical protein JWO02_3140 [Solirubrobacterales bacterium]|nr:hypothetical protein [Solirubrobacterales bacterium]